jgi:tRNA modification GTPase
MFHTDDTIVAIATPLGRSGVGLVRLSGPAAATIACALVGRARPLRPRHATLARLVAARSASGDSAAAAHAATPISSASGIADQVIVTLFPAPHSYTGDDVVEVGAHGSPVVLQGLLRAAIAEGARLAEPGEFTLRAFLNGKLDLVQAEAVADLVDAVTPLQARAAFDQLEGTLTAAIREIESDVFDLRARLEASLDFPDEGYHFVDRGAAAMEVAQLLTRLDRLLGRAAEGRMIREGAQVAIVGTPNVGKSSLFNALLNANRAIVTDIPGTTRDLLTERVDLRGLSVGLIDTAGIRGSDDRVEQEGIARARQAAQVADVTIVVIDGSRVPDDEDRALLDETASRPRLVVVNKSDLDQQVDGAALDAEAMTISVKTGAGLDLMLDRLAARLSGGRDDRDAPLVSNVRHITLLERARASLVRAREAVAGDASVPEEFLLADLQDVDDALQEITGRRTTEDLLQHIFERFCIGK